MQIATTKVCLNPQAPIKAIGYAQQTQPMERIRDFLYGRILLLRQGDEAFVLCALDLCYSPRSLQRQLQQTLETRWGAAVHVIISCTHTHFGPDIHDEAYQTLVLRQLADAILAMKPRTAQLTCGYAWEPYRQVGDSRISHWQTDQVLAHTLCFYEGPARVASLCIYNCHPTVLGGDTPFFTGEYPGVALRALESRHSGEFFAFLQGAAGDVSTRFTRRAQTEQEMEAFGLKMADEFDRLLAQSSPVHPLTLAYRERLLKLSHSLKNPDRLVIPDYYSPREREVLEYGIAFSKQNLAHPETLQADARIDTLCLGPYRLVFCENELFSEYNRALDPQRAALVCYAQGQGPYIAGPSFDGMTYETLQDTLSDASRQALLAAIAEAGK